MKYSSSLILIILLISCSSKPPVRDKFIGTYNVSESCNSLGGFNYEISILALSNSEDRIKIENFGDFRESIQATVVENGFNFDLIVTGIDARVEGSGTITNGMLIINYNLTNQYQDITGNIFKDSCTKTCSRI